MNDEEYNEGQREAIHARRGIAIKAGPGTGKTKTLVGRYLELAERENYDFSRLVAITFTKNAANELRERIARAIPDDRLMDFITNLRIGTIHAFCESVIRKHATEIGISPGFTILDEDQATLLAGSVIDDFINELAHEPSIDIFDNFRKKELKQLFESFLAMRPINEVREVSFEDYAKLSDLALDALVLKDIEELLSLLRALPKNDYIEGIISDIARYPSADLREKAAIVSRASDIERKDIEKQVHRTKETNDILKAITEVKNRLGKVDDDCYLKEFDIEYEYSMYQKLCSLLREIDQRYAKEKREKDLVDFNDMLMLTRELLQREDVAREEGNAISHLIVDEFQDVDRVQYEIFRSLLGESFKEKLTIAGDPKQAIYSFRGGEMNIFNEANRELETKPLAQSYRATPRLTNFFNFIARACFHGGEHSPEYQELFTTLGSESSTVSFDLVMNGKEDDEAREEMPLIIPRIAEMQEKGIELGNMAILLDSRAELAELVKALIDNSIPFEVLSGSGFFETPEVRSVMAFIDFLYDARDDVALFAILRSPLFGLSDRDIYEVSRDEGKDLYHKLKVHHNGIYEMLGRYRNLVDRRSLSELLEDLINRTNYRGTLAESKRGSTAVRNVEKFVSRVRNLELSGIRSVYAIREEIKGVAENGSREGEENVPQENCIKVMTIHAAKGLEFDAVFIPYLYKRYNLRSDSFVFRNGYLGLKINVKEFSPYTKNTIIKRWIVEEMRNVEIEEKKRLLYVAMTRAKKHIVFTGKKSISDKEIKSGMAAPGSNRWCSDVLDPAFTERFGISLSQIALDEYLNNKKETHIDIVWDGDDIKGIGVVEREPTEFRAAEMAPPAIELSGAEITQKVRIDPSGAEDLYTCKARYVIKNLLGVGEDPSYIKGISMTKRPEGKFYGEVLHRALELNFAAKPEKVVKEIAIRENVLLDESVMNRAIKEIADAEKAYRDSELRALVESADQVRREAEVYRSFGNFVIEGKIDLLIRKGDHTLIVDYKSESPRELESSIAKRMYAKQLQLYGLCVGGEPELAIYGIKDGKLRHIEMKDLTEEISEIAGNIIKEDLAPKDPQNCERCDLKDLCRYRP